MSQTRPPNILLILIDDLNSWVGAYGGRHSAFTPNIDKLAQSGAFYRRAYCAAPYCNASRISLFTGLLPLRTGVYRDEPLTERFATFPEVFQRNGYRTFSAGKVFHGAFDYVSEAQSDSGRAEWRNVSDRAEYWNEAHGFSFEPLPSGRPFNSMFGQTPRAEWPSIYSHFDWGAFESPDAPDEVTVDKTISFLQEQHRAPFLCCAGLYRPHLPWFAPRRYFDLYPLDEIPLPVVKPNDLDDVPSVAIEHALWPFDHQRIVDAGVWRLAIRAYLACISYCDELVGRIVHALETSAHRDNTIVVLASDNGFHHGQKLHWSKFALWEEASRVPLILRAPGSYLYRGPSDLPVSLIDIWPTLLDLTGVEHTGPLDGEALASPRLSPKLRRTPVITTWQRGNHSIRESHWRYTRYHDGGEELYDHLTDPFEWHNLAGRVRVRKKREELSGHLERVLMELSENNVCRPL